MNRPLWVYKCNAKNNPYQSSYGDWDHFFDSPNTREWGGDWGIKNPVSVRILRDQMKPGDLVLAYQTDRAEAVGLCTVSHKALNDEGSLCIYLTPSIRFEQPVPIRKLKATVPGLKAVRAFDGKRYPQTLYETSPEEAELLLVVCEADSHVSMRPGGDSPTELGAGFGSYDDNRAVEKAAIKFVRRHYQQRGWQVDSHERARCGYDLCCTKGRRSDHVEVKGVSGDLLSFVMTRNELECSERDPSFILAVVTRARTRERQIQVFKRAQMRRVFEWQPIQFAVRARK